MKGNLIIRNAAELVTCSGTAARCGEAMQDLGVISDGAVVVHEGIISAVGKTRDILGKIDTRGFTVIDAEGRTVLPGFVDSHTHLVFDGYRADEFSWRLRGDSYMDIMQRGGGIARTVAATRAAASAQLVASGLKRLDSMLSFGVTTVEGKSGYGLDLDTEIKQLEAMVELDAIHPVEVVRTFLGAHAVPAAYRDCGEAYIDFLCSDVLPVVAERKLADFCDIFCEKDVFSIDQSRRLLLEARQAGLGIKLHADEIVPFGGAELAAELGAVSADHLLHASDTGIRRLAQAGVVCTLLPLTAFSLKEPYARSRFMIDSGCAVSLASDFNPGSCFSESIPLIIALATLYMGMSPEETITALTINGAAALGRARAIGSIEAGKQGDLVIHEFPSYRYLPYHIGVSTVEKVFKNGTLVYDKTLMEARIARKPAHS